MNDNDTLIDASRMYTVSIVNYSMSMLLGVWNVIIRSMHFGLFVSTGSV